jgi:hypothetical protein
MTRDFSKLKTHTLRNKLYRLIWRRPPGKCPDTDKHYVGQCESPKDKGRELWLEPKQDAEDLLWTTVHESAHGCFWDLTEEAIEEFERDTRRLCRRMGLRISFTNE